MTFEPPGLTSGFTGTARGFLKRLGGSKELPRDLQDGPGGGEERFGVVEVDSEMLRNSSAVYGIAWGFSWRDLEFLRVHLLMHRNDLGTFPPDQPLLWSGLESVSIDCGMHRNDLEVYGTTSGLSGRTWIFNSLASD
jgi:hypothetical protein